MQRYHMTDIIPLLSIPQPPMGRASYNIPCPLCDHAGTKKGHLNINLKRDVFRCPKCGQFSGGVFDLYSYYENIPRDEVLSAIAARLGDQRGSEHNASSSPLKTAGGPLISAPPDIPQASLADIDTRDRVYRALLNKLSLASDHRENLLGRGLDDGAIQRLAYRTTPMVGFHALASELIADGYDLFGIPGFYRDDDGRWTMAIFKRGIMLPCRDCQGRIQRLHIRIDKRTHNKFMPFSSTDRSDGCTAENWCHVVGPVRETILLTEGYMKADIVNHLTGQTLVAMSGVTALNHLEATLRELISLGARRVMTCFDMDYMKNWHVECAYRKLVELLGGLDITFGSYLWVHDHYGLDDYVWEFCMDKGRLF